MLDRLPNREVIEIILFIVFWGQIVVIALLGYIIYRINHIKGSQNLIARGINRLMGMTGE